MIEPVTHPAPVLTGRIAWAHCPAIGASSYWRNPAAIFSRRGKRSPPAHRLSVEGNTSSLTAEKAKYLLHGRNTPAALTGMSGRRVVSTGRKTLDERSNGGSTIRQYARDADRTNRDRRRDLTKCGLSNRAQAQCVCRGRRRLRQLTNINGLELRKIRLELITIEQGQRLAVGCEAPSLNGHWRLVAQDHCVFFQFITSLCVTAEA